MCSVCFCCKCIKDPVPSELFTEYIYNSGFLPKHCYLSWKKWCPVSFSCHCYNNHLSWTVILLVLRRTGIALKKICFLPKKSSGISFNLQNLSLLLPNHAATRIAPSFRFEIHPQLGLEVQSPSVINWQKLTLESKFGHYILVKVSDLLIFPSSSIWY